MSAPKPIPRNRPLEPQDVGLPRRSPPMDIPGAVPRKQPRPLITRDPRRPGHFEVTLPDLASPSDLDPANRPRGPNNNIVNGSPVVPSHRFGVQHRVTANPTGGLSAEDASRLPANIVGGVGVPPSHRRGSGNTPSSPSVPFGSDFPGFIADLATLAYLSGMQLPPDLNSRPGAWTDIVRKADFKFLYAISGTSSFSRRVVEPFLPFRHLTFELLRTMATADGAQHANQDDQPTVTPQNLAALNRAAGQNDDDSWTFVSITGIETSDTPASSATHWSSDDHVETLHLDSITGATLEFRITSTHFPHIPFCNSPRLGLAPLPRQFVTRDLEEGLKWVQAISEHTHAIDIVLPAHVAANWESTRWGGSFVQAWQDFTTKAAELDLFANVRTVRLSSDMVRVPPATFPKLNKIVRHSATEGNPGRDVPIPAVPRLIDIVKYTCFDTVRPGDSEELPAEAVLDHTTRLISRRSMHSTDVVVIVNLLPNSIRPASQALWEATLLTYLTAYLAAVKSLTVVINDEHSLPPSPSWNYPHTNRYFTRAFWARRWVFVQWRNQLPSRVRAKVTIRDYDQYHTRVGPIVCEFEDIMTAC